MRISRFLGRAILFDESEAVASRPQRQKSKISAFLSDFRDLQVGDYVVHVEHGIGQYQGLKEINQGDGNAEFMLLEYAEGARLYVPLTRLRPDSEIPFVRRREAGAEPSGHGGLGEDQGTRAQGHEGHGRRTSEALRRTQDGQGPCVLGGQRVGCASSKTRSNSTKPKTRTHAIADVKRDMESSQPMDRLLCGDVGLRQDGSRHARRFQGHQRQQAGRGAGAHYRAGLSALRNFQAALCGRFRSRSR